MAAKNTVEVILEAEDRASKEIAKVGKSIKGFQVVAVASFVQLAASAAKFTKAVLGAADAGSKFADAIGDMSNKIGVSTETLSTLGFAASVTGGNLASMETGLRTLNRQALVAAQGSKSLGEIFNRMGVSVTDASGQLKSTEVLLAEVADGLTKLGSKTEQAAVAQTLFGRAGGDLIPILQNGAKGMAAFRDRAEELGVVIDSKAAKAADLFQDTLVDVKNASLGASISIGNNLLPELQPAIAMFTGLVTEIVKFAEETGFMVTIGKALATTLKVTAIVGLTLFETFQKVIQAIATATAVSVAFVTGDFSLIPGIIEAGAEQFKEIEKDTNRFIDAMVKAEARALEFNKTVNKTAGTNEDAAGTFALVQQEINKQSEALLKANNDQKESMAELAAARIADSAGFIEGEQAKFDAVSLRLTNEAAAEIEKLNNQESLLEKQLENDEQRLALQQLFEDQRTAINQTAINKRTAAAEASARAAIAAFQKTVAPITQAIEETTTAAIRGEISVAEAFKKIGASILKTALNQAIDIAVGKILATQITEVGIALTQAPGTFGASLLKIPLILAAAAAAKGAVSAIAFRHGGLVTGGTPGVDSVPALLTPGEFVLPRGVTDFLRAALIEPSEGPEFQEGGMVGEGGGGLTINAREVRVVTEDEDASELAEKLSDGVEFRGIRLVASDVVA